MMESILRVGVFASDPWSAALSVLDLQMDPVVIADRLAAVLGDGVKARIALIGGLGVFLWGPGFDPAIGRKSRGPRHAPTARLPYPPPRVHNIHWWEAEQEPNKTLAKR
jgi:hypothetical protein